MTGDAAGRETADPGMMSPNQAEYIEILANRTMVGHRLEDGIRAILGEVPRETVTREQASRVIEGLKARQDERRRQRGESRRTG